MVSLLSSSLNLAITSWWSEPRSSPGLVFALSGGFLTFGSPGKSLNTIFSTLCNHVYICVYLYVSPGTSSLLFISSSTLWIDSCYYSSLIIFPSISRQIHSPLTPCSWDTSLSFLDMNSPLSSHPESYIQYRHCLLPFYLRIQLSAERMDENTHLTSKFFTVLPKTSGTSGQIRW